jgi:DNA-directed RNA polymerase specialized sigma24 family protein
LQRNHEVPFVVGPETDPSSNAYLLAFLQENSILLQSSIRLYVLRMRLAVGNRVQEVTQEILQETVIEALAHAERLTTTKQPMAWLLGIALNMMRRRKVEEAKRFTREYSFT